MEGASSVDFNTARNLLVQGSNENSNNEREKAEVENEFSYFFSFALTLHRLSSFV